MATACFLNRPIAAVDTPQKIHNLNLEWLKIEIVIVRGGVSTAPIGLSTILIGLSTILIGLSTVCPWFVHGFVFLFFLKKKIFDMSKLELHSPPNLSQTFLSDM